jgi:hypothetical protein
MSAKYVHDSGLLYIWSKIKAIFEPKINPVAANPSNYYWRGDKTWTEKLGGTMILAPGFSSNADQGNIGDFKRCLLSYAGTHNTNLAYFSMPTVSPTYITVLKACRIKISGALAVFLPTGAALNQVIAGAIMIGESVAYVSRVTIRSDDYATIPLAPYITDVAANTQIGLATYRSGANNMFIQTGSFILVEVIEAVV